MKHKLIKRSLTVLTASAALLYAAMPARAADKKPNILILMQDDTGWFDFGCYIGGQALGHPTPNVDRWPRKARCSRAGTARPVARPAAPRSSPGASRSVRRCRSWWRRATRTRLRKETPTIAEFFKKNGYQTYFSGKWHLGDKPDPTRSSTASTR